MKIRSDSVSSIVVLFEQGQAGRLRVVAAAGPAAAAVRSAPARRGAGSDPDGRALFGAGPDLNGKDRRTDAGTQEKVHDCDRDP